MKNKGATFIRRFWPSLLVVAVILYATLASQPLGADELPVFPGYDKVVHAIMMGGLVGAIAFDVQRADRTIPLRRPLMWVIFSFVAMFGITDEILQGMIDNGRSSEMADLAADLAGALAAVYIAPPVIKKVLKIK